VQREIDFRATLQWALQRAGGRNAVRRNGFLAEVTRCRRDTSHAGQAVYDSFGQRVGTPAISGVYDSTVAAATPLAVRCMACGQLAPWSVLADGTEAAHEELRQYVPAVCGRFCCGLERRRAAYLGLMWFVHNHHSQEYATMSESTNATIEMPALAARDVLTDILRQGAQQMLAAAIEAEVAEWIAKHCELVDEQGHRLVVRNGYHNKRNIVTGLGPLEVQQPRVHDRRPPEQREKFSSKILPPYLRKAKVVEELLPWLYLKGISTGDMNEALQSLLGADCPGLSASTVTSLKKTWEGEFKEWNSRSLEGKENVYVWADGVHFNIRLEEDRQCILVLMGVKSQPS
jgi:hypothetical protein